MNDKVIWDLSDEDFKEIEDLFEKRLALENLIKVVGTENLELYNKVVADYGKVMRLFNAWWPAMGAKYKWEGQNWWVNFETHQVLSKD